MIEGNDGGACVSFNGGDTWSTIYNQPTAQFYHVDTDSNFPYRVYGTQQDNTAMSVPSRSHKGAIPYSDCYQVGTSESGHIAVRPDNSDIVYSGAIGSSPRGRRLPPPLRPQQRPGSKRHRLAGSHQRPRGKGCPLPIPVDLPHPHLAPRPERPLHRRQPPIQIHRRRHQLGVPQPRPDP